MKIYLVWSEPGVNGIDPVLESIHETAAGAQKRVELVREHRLRDASHWHVRYVEKETQP